MLHSTLPLENLKKENAKPLDEENEETLCIVTREVVQYLKTRIRKNKNT